MTLNPRSNRSINYCDSYTDESRRAVRSVHCMQLPISPRYAGQIQLTRGTGVYTVPLWQAFGAGAGGLAQVKRSEHHARLATMCRCGELLLPSSCSSSWVSCLADALLFDSRCWVFKCSVAGLGRAPLRCRTRHSRLD